MEFELKESESESHSVMSNSLRPQGLYSSWDSPGQNTGVLSHSLLQGTFPTQELNQGLLHCRKILYREAIPAELFQILKDDAVKVLHSICQKIWKIQQWPQDWKSSVFIPIPKKGNAKECSNYLTIAFISHASKVMFKILQARLQQYVNQGFLDVQVAFRKGRGTRYQIANICRIIDKQGNSRKTSTSASLIMLKSLCESQQTVGNS